MAVAYAGQWSGGGTSGTSDRSASGTPAIGELLVVFCAVTTNTNSAPTCSDDRGGTYYLAGTATWDTSTDTVSVFVRTKPVESAVAHNVTVATGANDAGVVGVIRVSGMRRFGQSAVLQFAKADNGAASSAPAFSFGSSCVTTNVTVVGVGSADTTTTAPTDWTERIDANQSTPTTALEVATRDSGFTGTTVTWGATQSTTWAAAGIELDCSAPSFLGAYPTTAVAMNTACGGGTWSAGWLFNESSGNAAAAFGSPSLTATGCTYSNGSMLSSGETSIGFAASTDKLDGGNVHDPTTNDLCFLWVGKKPANSFGDAIASKWDGTNGIGWQLIDNFGSTRLRVQNFGASFLADANITYTFGPDEWIVLMGCVDRGAAILRLAMYAPSVGYKSGIVTSLGTNTLSTTDALILGKSDIGNASTVQLNDAFYVGAGSGVASSMGANLISRLHSFVTSLETAAAVPEDTTTNTNALMLLGVG